MAPGSVELVPEPEGRLEDLPDGVYPELDGEFELEPQELKAAKPINPAVKERTIPIEQR